MHLLIASIPIHGEFITCIAISACSHYLIDVDRRTLVPHPRYDMGPIVAPPCTSIVQIARRRNGVQCTAACDDPLRQPLICVRCFPHCCSQILDQVQH